MDPKFDPNHGVERSPAAPDVWNDNIAGFSQGDLRRFIVNLLASDPGAVPKQNFPDTARGRGRYLGRSNVWPTIAPLNLDEFDFIADATAGVVWRFLYRGDSTSTNKWEFIGGPPLTSQVDTSETTASTSFVDLTTVGPSITIPRAGDYIIEFSIRTANDTNGAVSITSPKLGAAATADNDSADFSTAAANQTSRLSRVIRRDGLAASAVVKLQYRVTLGTGTWVKRNLSIYPVRLS